MKKIALLAVVVLMVLMAGCDSRYFDEGSGQMDEKTYHFDDFNALEVSSAFKVVVTQGDCSVRVQMDKSYIDDLLVQEHGGTLKIGLKPGLRWNMFSSEMTAYITMPSLDSVEASGATQVTVKPGMVYGDDVHIQLSGAAYMESDIVADRIDFDLSGAAHFEGTVEAEELRGEVSGASALDVEGKSAVVDITASGASRFNNKRFLTNELYAEASGASSISLQVEGNARVEASGASTITLSGSPHITAQDVDMTSTLNLD